MTDPTCIYIGSRREFGLHPAVNAIAQRAGDEDSIEVCDLAKEMLRAGVSAQELKNILLGKPGEALTTRDRQARLLRFVKDPTAFRSTSPQTDPAVVSPQPVSATPPPAPVVRPPVPQRGPGPYQKNEMVRDPQVLKLLARTKPTMFVAVRGENYEWSKSVRSSLHHFAQNMATCAGVHAVSVGLEGEKRALRKLRFAQHAWLPQQSWSSLSYPIGGYFVTVIEPDGRVAVAPQVVSTIEQSQTFRKIVQAKAKQWSSSFVVPAQCMPKNNALVYAIGDRVRSMPLRRLVSRSERTMALVWLGEAPHKHNVVKALAAVKGRLHSEFNIPVVHLVARGREDRVVADGSPVIAMSESDLRNFAPLNAEPILVFLDKHARVEAYFGDLGTRAKSCNGIAKMLRRVLGKAVEKKKVYWKCAAPKKKVQ